MALVHSTLQLFEVLRILKSGEDPNDDLVDAWKEEEAAAHLSLMKLVKQGQGLPDENNGPLQATFKLLAQEFMKWPKTEVEGADEVRT